jgi:DNA-directed RNA polymerase specialized sigma24 family protein
MDAIEELLRLHVLQLRKSSPTQAATIADLHEAGFSNARIAELLGTSADVVKVTVQRAKKKGAA